MKCKFGFYTCVNCIIEVEAICDSCEQGDNYEINENYEVQKLQE